MDFFYQLKSFLLESTNNYEYVESTGMEFALSYSNRFFGGDNDKKILGIDAMIEKIKCLDYQHDFYHSYSLHFDERLNYQKVLSFNPTPEELFNFYFVTSYGKHRNFCRLINSIKDTDFLARVIQYGYDYRRSGSNQILKPLLTLMHGEISVEMLKSYITHSIDVIEVETKPELAKICMLFIKDEKQAKNLISELLEIEVGDLSRQIKSCHVSVSLYKIVHILGTANQNQIDTAFKLLHELMQENISYFGTRIDMYLAHEEYHFIVYQDTGIDTTLFAIESFLSLLKNNHEIERVEKLKDLKEPFKGKFISVLRYHQLSRVLEEKTDGRKRKI